MDNKEITKRKILDVTCGSRSIWFNKHNPAATFCDNRKETLTDIWKTTGGSSCYTCVVDPDPLRDRDLLYHPSPVHPGP